MPRLATLSALLLTIPLSSQAQWTQACGECAIGEERTLPCGVIVLDIFNDCLQRKHI